MDLYSSSRLIAAASLVVAFVALALALFAARHGAALGAYAL